MKILVVCGGDSNEKNVSIKTGRAVFEALGHSFDDVECLICENKKHCIESIIEYKPDKVFIALHGGWGENGELQAALDVLGIEYTGSKFEASCLAMNKFAAKSIMKNIGLPVAKAVLIKNAKDIDNIDSYPICLKPNKEGSSIGVEFIYTKDDAANKILPMLEKFGEIIAEEKLNGRELTISILNKNIFSIIEIKPKNGFYNYENKYTKGYTEYIVPADLSTNIENLCKNVAYRAYQSLGCSGCARVDIILQNNIPYILEVNTMPGMTETSLVPKAAQADGIDFKRFVKIMIEDR